MRASERLGDLAEAEQPRVRVRGVGEPLQHHRQQGPLDRRGARHPAGQRLEVAKGRVGVEVAQGSQPGLRRLGGEPGTRRRGSAPPPPAAAGRRASRAVGAPRAGARAAACPARRLGGLEVAQRPAQPAQRRLVLGDHVRTPQLVQLHPVLHGAQEHVRVVQGGAVLPPDVAARSELGQRRQRGGQTQPRVGTAVHQLQQLHGELDVAQPAAAELDLPLGLLGRDVLEDPAAHRLDVGHEAVALGGLPHHRGDGLDVRRRRAQRHLPPAWP